jgi:hypothetical protein
MYKKYLHFSITGNDKEFSVHITEKATREKSSMAK